MPVKGWGRGSYAIKGLGKRLILVWADFKVMIKWFSTMHRYTECVPKSGRVPGGHPPYHRGVRVRHQPG